MNNANPPDTNNKKDSTPYHILLVAPQERDVILLKRLFQEEITAPQLSEVTGPEEASHFLSHQKNPVAVVFITLDGTGAKDKEFISKMVTVTKGIPLILLTPAFNLSFAIRSLALGISDYLLKESLSATVLYKCIIYNIERNKYIVQLKHSEHRYAELFHLSPQPMWVYEMNSLRFLNVNEAAIKVYGYSYNEFLNMTLKDIRQKVEVSKLMKVVNREKGKNEYYQGEFLHKKKNGEEIIVELQSNKISYNGKDAKIVLATDITERYQYIQSIEHMNSRLREIAWTQSHEVRAPLARIMGLVHLLQDTKAPAETEKLYENVLEAAEELDSMIRTIVIKTEL